MFVSILGGDQSIILAGFGPSPELVATMTASVWTPTPGPTPTPTITLSPKAVAYDLKVNVKKEAGSSIAGASMTFPESGNGEA